ncbi:MAG: hypothetical protein IPI50_07285 [Saprospiraceae bacterium]|nr:hypothetical protein [Saprospiraceae bacterium]
MKDDKKPKPEQKKGKIIKFEPSNDQEIGIFIEEMVLKYEKDFDEECYFEDIIEAGRVLWNMAILKKYQPTLFKELFPQLESDIVSLGLTRKKIQDILKRKEAKYTHSNYLADDVEILDTEEFTPQMLKVNLIKTEDISEFLKNSAVDFPGLFLFLSVEDRMGDDFDDSFEDEDDVIPGYMDRFNLVMIPRQNFILWAEKFVGEERKKNLLQPKSFAISDEWNDVPMDELIEEHYEKIMEVILMRTAPKKNWPKKVNLALFYDWFECLKTEISYDLESDMVLKFGEDYLDEMDFDPSLN